MSKRETESTGWRRSSKCEAGTCAEVKFADDGVLMRSSLAPETMIRLTAREWDAFLAGVVAGDFDDR